GTAVGVTPFPGYPLSPGFLSSIGLTDSAGQAHLPWLSTSSSATGTVVPAFGSGLPTTGFAVPAVSADTTINVVVPKPVTLSGVVRDASGQPLRGIEVALVGVPPSTASGVGVSGPDGSYSVLVTPGSYRLRLDGVQPPPDQP